MADYHLIAHFDSTSRAKAVGRELARFFATHAKQHDAMVEATDDEDPGPTDAAIRFGSKYGHTWKRTLTWGDDGLSYTLPEVVVLGQQLVIYDGYCPGFGRDLPAVLANAGGTLEGKERYGVPVFLVEFQLPRGDKGALALELERHLVQRLETSHLSEWSPSEMASSGLAWGQGEGASEDVTFVVRDNLCSITHPLHPAYVDRLREFLRRHKARNLTMRVVTATEVRKQRRRDAAGRKETIRVRKAEAKASPIKPEGLSFVLTGQFATGSMSKVKTRIEKAGGKIAKTITRHLKVLVVGDSDSALFGQSSPTDKQLKAERLNQQSGKIVIVSESALAWPKKSAKGASKSRKATKAKPSKPSASSSASIPRTKPTVEVVHEGQANYLYQATVSNGRLLVAGMHGENRIYASKDGKQFKQLAIPCGDGLRCVAAAGKYVWACGNRVAWISKDGGKSFAATKPPSIYVDAVVTNSQGRALITGLGTSWEGTGTKWTKVKGPSAPVWGMVATPQGIIMASHDGRVYRRGKRELEKLEVDSGGSLFGVTRTASGALVVVGQGGRVVRSDDDGESFTDRALKGAKDLRAVTCMADGRLVAAGDGGQIWCSYDDGKSFARIATKARQRIFWGATAFGESVYLMGMHEGIVRVGP